MNFNKNNLKRIIILPIILFLIGSVIYFSYPFISFTQDFARVLLSAFPTIGAVIMVLSILLLIYNLLILILDKYEHYLTVKYHAGNPVIVIIRKILNISFLVVFLNIITLFIPLSDYYQDIIFKIIYALLIATVGWFILQIIKLSETWTYNYAVKKKNLSVGQLKSQSTKLKIIRQIASILVVVITIAGILMLFSYVRNIGISLLASAGFITAIAGFAAQKPLSSIFTSFNLAFSQQIKLDDVVIIENEFGTIEEITMNYAVVKIWDSRRMVVPLTYFLEKPFQNWSYKATNLIGTIFLYVDYSLPIQELREELKNIVNASNLWDKKVVKLEVTELKDNCIEIRVIVSANTPDQLWNLRVEVREKLLEFIKMHYPECFPRQRLIAKD